MLLIQNYLNFRWDRIVAGAAPRLAAYDALETHPQAAHTAMPLDGFKAILRARGFKTTAGSGSTDELEKGPKGPAVNVDQENDGLSHQERGKIERRRARSNHSSRKSA